MSSKIALIPLPPQRPLVNPFRQQLWTEANRLCHWCKCETFLVNDNSWDRATKDHIIPRYKGGTNDKDNIVNACNLCNNRRNYEETHGLSEGALLGIYKPGLSNAQRKEMRRILLQSGRIVLTGDDKKAIDAMLAGKGSAITRTPAVKMSPENVLREQRDQALKELMELRKQMKHYEIVVRQQEEELRSMTVMKLIRLKLAAWLLK